ncbi:hypothetical protein ACFLT1_05835 [Bacteroidota bacterium]
MVRTSTLLYLMDDLTGPADMILSPAPESYITDQQCLYLLDLLETDPGQELVTEVLVRTGIKKTV